MAAELGVGEVLRTERPGHATELARAVGADADAIYVYSGDGGFNEVLNGSDGSVPLGFVPGGGTSVLPRALGLPRDPVAAARALHDAEPRRISLGRVNGRRFGFSAGLGLDAELIRRVDALGRDASGRRAGDLRFAASRCGRSPSGASASTRRSRSRATGGPRSCSSRTATRTPTSARIPLRLARRARFEGGLDAVGPRGLRLRHLPAQPSTSPRVGPRCRCCRSTTSTASSCAATARCRCRSTARTSATWPRPCSRRSATRSRCSAP